MYVFGQTTPWSASVEDDYTKNKMCSTIRNLENKTLQKIIYSNYICWILAQCNQKKIRKENKL